MPRAACRRGKPGPGSAASASPCPLLRRGMLDDRPRSKPRKATPQASRQITKGVPLITRNPIWLWRPLCAKKRRGRRRHVWGARPARALPLRTIPALIEAETLVKRWTKVKMAAMEARCSRMRIRRLLSNRQKKASRCKNWSTCVKSLFLNLVAFLVNFETARL